MIYITTLLLLSSLFVPSIHAGGDVEECSALSELDSKTRDGHAHYLNHNPPHSYLQNVKKQYCILKKQVQKEEEGHTTSDMRPYKRVIGKAKIKPTRSNNSNNKYSPKISAHAQENPHHLGFYSRETLQALSLMTTESDLLKNEEKDYLKHRKAERVKDYEETIDFREAWYKEEALRTAFEEEKQRAEDARSLRLRRAEEADEYLASDNVQRSFDQDYYDAKSNSSSNRERKSSHHTAQRQLAQKIKQMYHADDEK